jgi:hypothetical protein
VRSPSFSLFSRTATYALFGSIVLPTIRIISKKNRLNYQWSASILFFPPPLPPLLLFSSAFFTYLTARTNPLISTANYRFKLLSERFAIVAKQLGEKKASFGPDDDADGKGGSEVVRLTFPFFLNSYA